MTKKINSKKAKKDLQLKIYYKTHARALIDSIYRKTRNFTGDIDQNSADIQDFLKFLKIFKDHHNGAIHLLCKNGKTAKEQREIDKLIGIDFIEIANLEKDAFLKMMIRVINTQKKMKAL